MAENIRGVDLRNFEQEELEEVIKLCPQKLIDTNAES